MIDICFVYFRTTNLDHLDAAWFTLSKQDFTGVRAVVFLDNNTPEPEWEIEAVLSRYPLPVPVERTYAKHGNPERTQSWSVNTVTRQLASAPVVFFTRSDYLLDYDCLSQMRDRFAHEGGFHEEAKRFVTSHCHQMGYDDALSNTDALAPHSRQDAPWRLNPLGPKSLIGHVPAVTFMSTQVDAGVWMTRRSTMLESGGLDERLVSWGYQQQEFQRRIARGGVEVRVIDDFLFHHQHHWAPRDFAKADSEYNRVIF